MKSRYPIEIKLTETEFDHVVQVLAEDVVDLAEQTSAKLIREAVLRDYQSKQENGFVIIPLQKPLYGLMKDRKLSVSFRVYFDLDDIMKARNRRLKRKGDQPMRHLLLEGEANDG